MERPAAEEAAAYASITSMENVNTPGRPPSPVRRRSAPSGTSPYRPTRTAPVRNSAALPTTMPTDPIPPPSPVAIPRATAKIISARMMMMSAILTRRRPSAESSIPMSTSTRDTVASAVIPAMDPTMAACSGVPTPSPTTTRAANAPGTRMPTTAGNSAFGATSAISSGSALRPTNSISITTPTVLIAASSRLGSSHPSTGGPKITPATSSPRTGG